MEKQTFDEIFSWVRVAKGDVAGHEFHGNQYEEGEGDNASRSYSKAEEGHIADIQQTAGLDRKSAESLYEHILDIYDPDFSDQSDREWKSTIRLAANDGIWKRP